MSRLQFKTDYSIPCDIKVRLVFKYFIGSLPFHFVILNFFTSKLCHFKE